MIYYHKVTDTYEIYGYRNGKTIWIGHTGTREEANKLLAKDELMHRNDKGKW